METLGHGDPQVADGIGSAMVVILAWRISSNSWQISTT
jgi:hypothetical protein